MLSYLDTAIGFVVVMLGISLLITMCTQIASALVNHRGGNLLWGVKTLFANIDPAAFPNLTAQADPIARAVLSHCLVSDSWYSNNKVASWLSAKSRLLKTVFERFHLTSAIRPNELVDVLRHLATNSLAGTPVAAEIMTLLASNNPTAAREVNMVAATVAAAAPSLAGLPQPETAPLIQNAVNTVRDSAGRLEGWFVSMMDRVSQKFRIYMRFWTVFFSCIFAVATGLNAIDLLQELYANAAMRERLVNAAPRTEELLPGGAPASAGDIDAAKNLLAGGFDILKPRWPAGEFRWSYFGGVMISIILLSLGAPFWFNALKSLSNLRPVLALRQERDAERQ
ncbi:MAG: hypothetical protein KIT09_29530 [Bryobacteraceae bacterium]|nr:hypothetical protein [Bryobacteraceae bacterium]